MVTTARVLQFAAVLLLASTGAAQEAPLLTVLPRAEQVRQLELRADLRMVQKRYLEAIDFYREALLLSPQNPELLNKTGIAYHQLMRLDDARKYYERATKADKQYAHAWNNLGTIYYGQEKYKQAIRHYERALKVSPAQAAIHSNLGTALFARKKYDEALQEYRLALLLDPQVFEHRSLFGVLMQDFKVEDRARFNYLVAKGFASLGYVEQCIAYLRRALEDGYPPVQAQGDPAFALMREDERFQALFVEPPAAINR